MAWSRMCKVTLTVKKRQRALGRPKALIKARTLLHRDGERDRKTERQWERIVEVCV